MFPLLLVFAEWSSFAALAPRALSTATAAQNTSAVAELKPHGRIPAKADNAAGSSRMFLLSLTASDFVLTKVDDLVNWARKVHLFFSCCMTTRAPCGR